MADVPEFEKAFEKPDAKPSPLPVRWISDKGFDINGDGGRDDLLLAGSGYPGLLAVSGMDGSTIWWSRPNDVPSAKNEHRFRKGSTIGRPILVEIDNDGTPDVIFAESLNRHRYLNDDGNRVEAAATMVQAISGKTGKRIWEAALDPLSTDAPPVIRIARVDYDIRPFSLTANRHNGRPVVTAYLRTTTNSNARQYVLRTLDMKTGEFVGDPVQVRAQRRNAQHEPPPRPAGILQFAKSVGAGAYEPVLRVSRAAARASAVAGRMGRHWRR